MIAQLILTAMLAGIVLYAWAQYRQSPVVGSLASGAALIGIYFVWIPSHASELAAFVGIGRGVDLVLYLWVVISLLVILNLHLKLTSQLELITLLARQFAIVQALAVESPNHRVPNDQPNEKSGREAKRRRTRSVA